MAVYVCVIGCTGAGAMQVWVCMGVQVYWLEWVCGCMSVNVYARVYGCAFGCMSVWECECMGYVGGRGDMCIWVYG